MSGEWHRMSALALGARIESGAIDPRALTEYFLERIEAADGERTIYLRLTPARARAEAEAAHRRAQAGASGSRRSTACRSRGRTSTTARATSPATARRRWRSASRSATRPCSPAPPAPAWSASARPTRPSSPSPSSASTPGWARRPTPSTRRCRAYRAARRPGAAVSISRGLAAAAIGSDTGGSVRVPAAWNGLVGLKTSVGLLPLDGVLGPQHQHGYGGPAHPRRGRCVGALRRARRARRRRQPPGAGPRGRRSLPRPLRAADHAGVGGARSRRRGCGAGRGRAAPCRRLCHRRDAGAGVRGGRRTWSAASAPITPPSATRSGTTSSRPIPT